MRLIHTADWQIGKVFRFVGDDTMALLQAARLGAISRLGRLAREHGAEMVLVAGDVYDKEGLADRTLVQPLERMRDHADIAWHLIPGNHDPHRPNGIWQRVRALGLPSNVHVHLKPLPIPLNDQSHLLPAPLRQHQTVGDPTAWMNDAETPPGTIRIGLAHGSITAFGTQVQTPNLIAPDRAAQAGIAYLALGDWHGTKKINQRTWYAGTPEPDRFDRPESGQALLVEIGRAAAPAVNLLETGHYHWLQDLAVLHDGEDITRLCDRLRSEHDDLSRVLLDLGIEGVLSLAERACFEREIEISLGAALCHLRLSIDDLRVDPSADDLDELAQDHVIRDAVKRLKAIADDQDHADRDAADRALQHLYLACHKRQKGVAA
ncbi:MAG: metallophosphoesterase family protein [Geminicoccaceae bacterium]